MSQRWYDNRPVLIASLLLAAGLVAGGYLLGDGLRRARLADRSVTMRGLAERNVNADLATWSIAYSERGPELGPVQAALDRKTAAVRDFFHQAGFHDQEIGTAGTTVANMVENKQDLVTVRQRLQLHTRDVARARAAFARQADLVRAGVALEEGSGITYSFTRLDAIKPEMIAEATRDARRGAEQFAKDSGTHVGGIKSASQGYFSVGPRDGDAAGEEGNGGGAAGESPFQKVRVVTTIDFYLG